MRTEVFIADYAFVCVEVLQENLEIATKALPRFVSGPLCGAHAETTGKKPISLEIWRQ